MAIVHIQQGGSSTELYFHVHATQAEANACRKECEEASYEVSEDRVTRCHLTPKLIDLIDDLLNDAATIDF